MFDTDTPFDLLPTGRSRPDPVVDPLIADLEWLPTGVMLAAALDRVDRHQLSGFDRVTVLKARARQIAHDQAELLADIGSISESVAELANNPQPDADDIFNATASEVSAALTLTRRSSEIQVDLADALCERLPAVWKALSEGLIDLARARVMADQTVHLPRDLARQVCHVALDKASSQTTGQLRTRLQRLIISIDPASAKDRYEQKLTERKVVCEPTDAGTADIHGLDLPADQANAAMRAINTQAMSLKTAGDKRTMDQIRADIFLDLLQGHHIPTSHRDRAVVDITVDLNTLAGLDDKPGGIPGWGPVISDIARQVTAEQPDAEWRYTITNDDGQVVSNGTTRRRPTTTMKRAVEAKARTCVFPGCRMPSRECDIDHNQAWTDGGATTECNLAPLCRHHHMIKHRGWTIRQTKPGIYTWTSPLGHTYTTGPDP
jgi:hypothetical protein